MRTEAGAGLPWVFVYGTLKRGQSNVQVMAGARFAAPALSVQPWRLVALRHYPALVREAGPARIAGELWAVPEAMMVMLDRFEEVPALYTRHEIEVECLAADEAGGPCRRCAPAGAHLFHARRAGRGRARAPDGRLARLSSGRGGGGRFIRPAAPRCRKSFPPAASAAHSA
ncbi:gamma-glutamylcyclotransferase family protein [Herbaspirillum robiniae]|uniref:gamma-glutamylcyclotransferase family protein n=1 Tax=Herbaspirillum robiniae TaxID=2014887 RepID=UPI003D76CF3C